MAFCKIKTHVLYAGDEYFRPERTFKVLDLFLYFGEQVKIGRSMHGIDKGFGPLLLEEDA